jgi:outer membrane receptor for ferrienterochelin and colicin
VIKAGFVTGFFIILLTIAFTCNICSASEPQPLANSDIDSGITTEKELRLYFEEKDLITATKRVTPLRMAPAIATIITAEEIRNMGARNLLDVLKMVPGFGISISETGIHMIEVRGVRTTTSEKILFMIDGHSMNRNIFGSALYNVAGTLPVEAIKQVEIVRGPGSALYGNSAFVATINIITRDADEMNGLEVKGGGGNFNTYKGNIVGGKVIGDKLSISGSVDYFNTHGDDPKINRDVLGTAGRADLKFRQADAFMKIGYGDFSFRGGYINKRKDTFIGAGYALVKDSYDNLENYWAELAYAVRLTDSMSANLKVRYDNYSQNPFAKILPNGFPGFPDGMIGRPLASDRNIGTELQFDWDVFKGNHLIAGFSYDYIQQYDVKQYANFDPLTFAPLGSVQEVANWNKNARRQIFATYLQDEWQVLERVHFTAGVRYDHYSDFGDTVNPRAGLVWNFFDNADLKLLYGQAFRAPNFVELYDINNPVAVGNPDLKPEKIRTYEAGLTYRVARWLVIDANYFYSEITDLITLDTSVSPARYANFGKADIQGVETGLRGAYGSSLAWKMSYVYQDPRDGVTNKRLPYVPSHRTTGSINFAPCRYVNLHADLLWTGPRPRADGESRSGMPAYFTADIAVTFKNLIRNFEVQAAVHNLLNKRYYDPDTSGTQNKVPGDFPREGISALVTATYKF